MFGSHLDADYVLAVVLTWSTAVLGLLLTHAFGRRPCVRRAEPPNAPVDSRTR